MSDSQTTIAPPIYLLLDAIRRRIAGQVIEKRMPATEAARPGTGRAAGAGDQTAADSPCGHRPCHRRYGGMALRETGDW
ncbi:hypothetical protein [Streptomyces hygroscopicus]|uniref:hypothetical protein n=1 Tax=Streptomyces hygroscopicus TaxID=1912 RepID=UPI0036B34E7D